MLQKRMEHFRLLLDHLAWIEHQFLSGIRDSRKAGRCRRFAWSLSQGCSGKIRKKDVVMTAGRWSNWSIQIPQFLMLWWPAMKAGSSAMTQRSRDRVPSGNMLALQDPRRPDRTNPPTNFWWSLFLTALAWSTCTGFPLDRQWDCKGVQQEIPSEEASTLQIGSVAFPTGQCTSPQFHPCHRLFDQDGHHPPYSPDHAPCDFC